MRRAEPYAFWSKRACPVTLLDGTSTFGHTQKVFVLMCVTTTEDKIPAFPLQIGDIANWFVYVQNAQGFAYGRRRAWDSSQRLSKGRIFECYAFSLALISIFSLGLRILCRGRAL